MMGIFMAETSDLHVHVCLNLRKISSFVEVVLPGYRNDPQIIILTLLKLPLIVFNCRLQFAAFLSYCWPQKPKAKFLI